MIELDLGFINSILDFVLGFLNQIEQDIFTAPDTLSTINIVLFKYYGFLLYLWIFIRYLAYPEYMFYINNRWFAKTVTPILLAIDVPKRNEQSIQAMENLFDHLLGAHASITWWGKYIDGEFQLGFSCEIVSIEGHIQFLIRTPKHLRNLVEAAVYGQFPDAEITEVQDYVKSVPRYYPNNTHDLYGVEMTLSNKNVFLPIKTWLKFEHKFAEVFVDPIAALLETMSQIGPGEQIWIQFLIKPLPVDWAAKDGQKELNKITGKAEAPRKTIISSVFDSSLEILSEVGQQAVGTGVYGPGEEKKKEDQPFKILNLTPGQREQLENMEHKMSKLAFNSKIRYLYTVEKGKMNKSIGVNGIIGAFKQWTDMNGNGLKPDMKATGTNSPQYIMIEKRRNTRRNYIMGAYRTRDTVMGCTAKPLTSEELASLWHFPGMSVKAPFLKSTDFKKAAAPSGLPYQAKAIEFEQVAQVEEPKPEKNRVTPNFDYDNDEFEKQFAKDKDAYEKSHAIKKQNVEQEPAEESDELSNFDTLMAKKNKPRKNMLGANLMAETQAESQEQPKQDSQSDDSGNIPGNLPFLD
ncbi:MAG: hypothetical protein NTZ49_03155 [Candidatus Parcubacteria bacterium]|nr:hypothetical protein [Candidatus Parcubacteria bacterium]